MWLHLSAVILGIAVCLQVTSTRPVKNPSSRHKVKLWKPEGETREKFLRYHGLGQARFNKMKNDVIKLKSKIARKLGRQMDKSTNVDEFFDDILFTEEQVTYLLNLLKTRRKRKLIDFDVFPSNKWSQMPIKYKFDGTHDADDQAAIERALSHWQNHTCVRFQRVDVDTTVSENHLLFTSQSGCWSYIGRASVIPQQVNLQSSGCILQMGVPVHEVGHALGFFHEQSRPDRDNYVDIIVSNIIEGKEHNFGKREENVVNSMGVPYDYGSVMHYGSKTFAENTSIDTIQTKDTLYQQTLGQRNGLSDHDMKLANLAYCSDTCLSIACQQGGYVDPNNCTQCKCLDGFGGQYCETVASGNGGCSPTDSGVISVDSTEETCLESPNYATGPYNDFDRCNWILKAPTGCTIDFYFKDDFGVYCRSETYKPVCTHWVEIKFERNLTLRGPRFCGSSRSNITETHKLSSKGHEAVVIFRSDASTSWSGYRRGFKLCYKIGDSQCLTHGDVSTPNTSTTPTAALTSTVSTWSPSVSRTSIVSVDSTPFSTQTYDSTTDSPRSSQSSISPDVTTTQHVPSTVTTAIEHSTTTQTSTTTTSVPPTTQYSTTTTAIPTTTQDSTSTTAIPTTTQDTTSTTAIPTTTQDATSTTAIPTTTQDSRTTSAIPTTTRDSRTTTAIPTTTQHSTTTTTLQPSTQTSTTTTIVPTTIQTSPTTTTFQTTKLSSTISSTRSTTTAAPPSSTILQTTSSEATTAETTEATTSRVLSTTAKVVSTDTTPATTGGSTSPVISSTATFVSTDTTPDTTASSAPPSTTSASVTTEDPDEDCSDSSSSESDQSKSKCNNSSSSESEESTGSVESKESVESSESRDSKESEDSSESTKSRSRKNKKSKRKPKKNRKGRGQYRDIE